MVCAGARYARGRVPSVAQPDRSWREDSRWSTKQSARSTHFMAVGGPSVATLLTASVDAVVCDVITVTNDVL